MIHAALFFMFAAPIVVLGLVLFAIALCKEAARGDEQREFDAQHRSRVGLSENDVVLCQSRQRSRRGLTVMAGACGLTSDLSSKRGRGADTPDRRMGRNPNVDA
jgi:hypothetical protein